MKKPSIIFTICVLLLLMTGCTTQNPSDSGGVEAVPIEADTSIDVTDSAPLQVSPTAMPSPSPSLAPSENYDVEEAVAELFKNAELSNEDEKKLLAALPDINWSEYERYTEGKAYELLNWLYLTEITESENMLFVMKATYGLDGYMTEGYCSILANMLNADAKQFVECLAQLDESEAECIYPFAAYGCGYDNATEMSKKAIADFETLLNGTDLSEKEREVSEKLLQAFTRTPEY